MAKLTTDAALQAVPTALEAYIEEERRRADVAGTAVAAFDRDGILFAGGFGFADIARGERATPDTLFRAASITKLFTTTLVLQEVDRGAIDLDQPVNSYLDDETRLLDKSGNPADGVTVRHLLTHMSGLPVSWRGLEYGPAPLKLLMNGRRPTHTLRHLVAGQQTVRAPGKRMAYSNGAFELLGYVAERTSGRPYDSLIRERVLSPLGMERSGLAVAPGGPGVATPYGGLMMGAGRKPAPTLKNYSGPAGALITSALELSRFGRMVLRGGELDGARILPEPLLQQATDFQARNHPELDRGLGLGFWVADWRGRRLTHHEGGLAGVATRLLMAPQDGVGVTVLTNGADPAYVHRVSERLLESLLGLEPEVIPGSPAGMAPGTASEWKAFHRRVIGRYRLMDLFPPGPLASLLGLTTRPRLTEAGGGALALEGFGREPTFLYPDGAVGRYRVAFPMGNGARAVIEERRGKTHLWVSILHLQKRR